MSKTISILIGILALLLCIAVLGCGLNKLNTMLASGAELQNTLFDIKSLRSGVITLCTASIGLFAVFFELGSKDKYGHSIKQDNHFELTCLQNEAKRKKKPLSKRALSGLVLAVYPVSIALVLLTTLTYIYNDSDFAVKCMFVIFCVSALLACFYVLYILHVVYSRDWIVNKVTNILKTVNADFMNNPSKLDIATKAMRILSTSDYPTPADIISIHGSTLFSRIEEFKVNSNDSSVLNSALIDYYANLIVSYFLSAKGATESVNPGQIIEGIFTNKKTDYTKQKGEFPYFIIPALIADKELNHLSQSNTGSPIGMDTLLLRHRRIESYKYTLTEELNSIFGSAAIGYFSDHYIYPEKKECSDKKLPDKFKNVNEKFEKYFEDK